VPIAGATGLLAALQSSQLAQDLLHPATRVEVNQFLPGLRLDCSFLQAWQGVGTETVATSCGEGNALLVALPYLLLIGIMGFTTYYQQRQLMAGRGAHDQQAQQMQMVMRFMPLLLMAFAIGIPIGPGFPAGVVLYWVTTNLWTIAQQRIILARLGPAPAIQAKANPKGKSTDGSAKKATSTKGDGKKTGATPKTSKPPAKKPRGRQPGNGAKSTAKTTPGKKKRRR